MAQTGILRNFLQPKWCDYCSFWCVLGGTRICWYPLNKSIFESIPEPLLSWLRNLGSEEPGIGLEWLPHWDTYSPLRGTIRLKLLAPCVAGRPMQGLFEQQRIPVTSILRNSALAEANLSIGNRQAHTLTGGPVILMKCSTPCLVGKVEKVGIVISRKLAINLS